MKNINLWGHVQSPGAYEIPVEYGLLELISHAGGPSETSNLDEIKIVRAGNEVIVVNLTHYINTGDEKVLVQLQPGDTVIVGGSLGDVFSSFVSYIRDFAFILTSIHLLTNSNK